MLYLYNNSTDIYKDLYRKAYESLDEYLGPAEEVTDAYEVMFIMSLNDIFDKAKRRTAMRGRFAKDPQGGPLLEGLAMTDDERDFFDQVMPNASSEVFRKLSAFAKTVANAHKFNVTFGLKAPIGTVTSVSGTLVTDSSLGLTPSSLIGYRFVITTTGEFKDMERDITENSAGTITLELPFEGDITGLEYSVYNPAEMFAIYSIKMDLGWDINQLMSAESAIMEALILYAVKEWYKINRYLDDFAVEDATYEKELLKIRSALIKSSTPYRRTVDQFS